MPDEDDTFEGLGDISDMVDPQNLNGASGNYYIQPPPLWPNGDPSSFGGFSGGQLPLPSPAGQSASTAANSQQNPGA